MRANDSRTSTPSVGEAAWASRGANRGRNGGGKGSSRFSPLLKDGGVPDPWDTASVSFGNKLVEESRPRMSLWDVGLTKTLGITLRSGSVSVEKPVYL